MPPAAMIFDYSSCVSFEEQSNNSMSNIAGIEVEAIEIMGDEEEKSGIVTMRISLVEEASPTRVSDIRMPPRSINTPTKLPQQHRPSLEGPTTPKGETGGSRYDFLTLSCGEKSLADSFDSTDEIKADSNEARLISRLAMNHIISYNPNTGLSEPMDIDDESYFLNETEAKYLDVLDKHLDETDPGMTKFSELDESPDGNYPRKNEARLDDILNHLVGIPCCECVIDRPAIKSILKPSKWTPANCSEWNCTPAAESGDNYNKGPSIVFKDVDIREFDMTLGNHPSATSGPPVRLDWESGKSQKVVSLEDYERAREPRRSRRQLKLSLQQRHGILVKQRGFSFEEVKSAWQDALEIRKQRKETLERGMGLMKWDEVWESTCRKVNRLVDGTV
jgi:hypothetical protein